MFSIERRDVLDAEREEFFERLRPATRESVPFGLTVVEFKEKYGKKIVFKHLPGVPFFLDDEASRKFDKKMADRIQMVRSHEGSRLIVSTAAQKSARVAV